MQIKLKQISYRNFKGIVNFDIALDEKNTHIYGENGTGKTSLMDGFMWLLFGKDSDGRADFNIKTLDPYGNPINKLEHEVQATFDIDGAITTMRRVYKEKWTKKRGEEIAVFDGHVQDYFFNDVPMQQKEYNEKIAGIIKEDMFKLLTSPMYFNSLPWQKRREILFSIATPVSNDFIAARNPEYAELVQVLTAKSVDEYKKELASKKKIIKDQLISIPARIDEAERTKAGIDIMDKEPLMLQGESMALKIAEIEDLISDSQKAIKSQADAYQQAMQEKNALITKVAELKRQDSINAMAGTQELEGQLRSAEMKLQQSEKEVERIYKYNPVLQNEVTMLNNELAALRTKWAEENAKELEFNNDTNCPTCRQALPEGDVAAQREAQHKNYNANKNRILAEITAKATSTKSRLEQVKLDIDLETEKHKNLTAEQEPIRLQIESLKNQIEQAKTIPFAANPEIEMLQNKIDAFVAPEIKQPDNTALMTEKAQIQLELDEIKSKLAAIKSIEGIDSRVKELMQQEQTLNQELAALEKQEFLIQKFSKDKIEIVEQEINNMFLMVKWKLFEQQINGGETECCVCMVNGVPYSDVNTA